VQAAPQISQAMGPLQSETKGVFKCNESVLMYEIFSGNNKDYYLTISTSALNQQFNMFKKKLISDQYEERARSELRKKGTENPTKKSVASMINDIFRPEFEELCQQTVIVNKVPESTWIPALKKKLDILIFQN
jgi:hypothetical protein